MTQVGNVKARILIIEDDKILNKQLRVLLDVAVFEVTQSYYGDAGLLNAVSDQFDVILLDVALLRIVRKQLSQAL